MSVKIFNKIASIIYPPKCIFCQKILNHSTLLHICSDCYSGLPFAQMAVLATSQENEENFCDGAVSVFQYTGVVKESLIRFKFYNEPSYYKTYAKLIADRFAKMADIKQYDMVMSVPLHKHKEFSRGYNQAYLISKELGRELKLPEGSKLIKRYRNTEAQSLLDKQKRSQNVKGAFTIKFPEKVAGKSILLVDDILTTGSTLEECSRELKNAGAIKVTAVVVATGRDTNKTTEWRFARCQM